MIPPVCYKWACEQNIQLLNVDDAEIVQITTKEQPLEGRP